MARPKSDKKLNWVDFLTQAGPSDLEGLRERIAELERELESLRIVERAIDVRLNGKPAKGPGRKKKAADPAAAGKPTAQSQRSKVYEYLKKVGAAKPATICADCGIPSGSITYVLDCEEFKRDPNGFVKLAA